MLLWSMKHEKKSGEIKKIKAQQAEYSLPINPLNA